MEHCPVLPSESPGEVSISRALHGITPRWNDALHHEVVLGGPDEKRDLYQHHVVRIHPARAFMNDTGKPSLVQCNNNPVVGPDHRGVLRPILEQCIVL